MTKKQKVRNHRYYVRNREAKLAKARRYRIENPELAKATKHASYYKYAARDHKQRLQLKREVLTFYGNGICACVKCGFADMKALCIDHINDNGATERKALGTSSSGSFYKYLRRNSFPLGYQTLCANCNQIKEYNRLQLTLPYIK